jgi:esterase FrsA
MRAGSSLLVLVCTGFMLCGSALAQRTFPGDLAALKAEVQRRAEIGRHPVEGYDPAEIRAGLATLASTSEDDWAAAWMAIGDRYAAEAERALDADSAAASANYESAYRYYVLARWPAPTSPNKQAAYRKGLETFRAWDRLTELPTEAIELKTAQGSLVGLLRLPARRSGAAAPLIVQLGGLDGYKENGAMGGALRLARAGVAVLSLDSPGSAPQTVRASPEAWQTVLELIDRVTARPEIDAARVALRGNSWGGYWAAVLAHRAPERFVGVVAQGLAVHRAFDPRHIDAVVEAGEYLFDFPIALEYAFADVTDRADLEARWAAMSLSRQGLLDEPTPPILLLNGVNDQIFPVQDLFLLLQRGSAKEAWINPKGIHMGREPGVWETARITNEIILPWLFRRLELPPL